MSELPLIVAVALAAAVAVGVPGAVVLRLLHRRSVVVHICVVLLVTVGAVLAGVVAVAQAMFLSRHDLQVLLVVVATSAVVSLGIGWWLGRRLARRAVWAWQLRERERSAEAARRDLVAWVSHDLRTPLAGLRAMAEALEDEVVSDPATVRDYHSRIRVETERMAALVDDLFQLSRIHAGAIRLAAAPVPLGELVSDVLASSGPVARARQVALVAAEAGWPTVAGSEPELRRVVANLVRNAVQATPPGGSVRVSAGAGEQTAWVAVADSCGGIPDSDLPRVFDVAFRAERSRTLRDGSRGGGLGLAIVRGLVEAHGGRVEVTNTGPGCRFVVHLPIRQRAPGAHRRLLASVRDRDWRERMGETIGERSWSSRPRAARLGLDRTGKEGNVTDSANPRSGSPASTAFGAALDLVAGVEPRVADAIRQELSDQRESLKLIASENYASPAVLAAMGNWLSDKYAEGTIGRRFYAGCQNVDTVEAVAAEHARELFGAPHAYVQPHSGIDANLVAFWAVLAQRVEAPALARARARHVNDLAEPDWQALRRELGSQRALGMSLDAGGHLTHGFRPNISGKMFEQRSYGVDPSTGLVDYAALREQAREFRPLVIVAGYSAYPRLINFATMRDIADEVGATLLVDMAHFAGLVAGKVLTGDYDPVPHAQIVTTTTHKSLRGPRGGMVLCQEELAAEVDRGCPMVLGGPLPHVMAAKAVALAEARTAAFQQYAQQVVANARALAEGLTRRGARLVTGGTDNHLVLLDVTGYGITGRQAESALLDSGVVTNRNSVPNDPNGAWYTSGIRLGTPALTSRGLGTAEMDQVADMIHTVLTETGPATTAEGRLSQAKHTLDPAVSAKVAARAAELMAAHPLYPSLEL